VSGALRPVLRLAALPLAVAFAGSTPAEPQTSPATAVSPPSMSQDPSVSSHPSVPWADALEQAKRPADFTRILADGPPELWDAAAEGLLGEKERVSRYALPVVLQRLEALGPETRFRVAAALVRDSHDPRVLAFLGRLAYEPHREDDPRLRAIATERLEDPGMQAAYGRYERGEEPFPKTRPTPPPPPDPPSEGQSDSSVGALSWLYLALLLVSGWLGFVIFLWGLRLLRLRQLVQGLPPSSARSLALGQVALQGEAQPLDGDSLTHPDTGEVCLYYEGAGRRSPAPRFCVVDDTGRVIVDPEGAVLLSADGVIVPGERVHLIGEARRDRPGSGEGAGEVTVGAPAFRRSAFQKATQFLVGSVMGGLFGRGSARMLFSDPLRCFWVWDDLQATPFTTPRETAWLVGSFLLAGTWVLVFLASAVLLLGR